MSDTKRVTGGPWIVRQAKWLSDGERDFGIAGIIEGTSYCIAETFGRAAKDVKPDAEANAKLIVTAVNACFSVSPERPQAVAEEIVEAFEMVKCFAAFPEGDGARALLQRMGKI